MSNHFRLFMQQLFFIFILGLLTPRQLLADALPANPATPPVTTTPNAIYGDTDPSSSFFSKSLAERNVDMLHDLLPKYQDAVENPWPIVPAARYKLHGKSRAIAILRERLIASGDLTVTDEHHANVYDDALAQAVMAFQARHGLKPDGVVGSNTIRELNVSPADRLNQLQVNIQRWQELADKLPNRFIMVNVPDFHLYVYDQNKQVLEMKAIVGRPTRQTPELSSRVTRIELNPYWNVPSMLAKKDIAPKVLNDPDYLDDMHIRIFDSQEDDAVEMDPDDVDWQSAAENGLPYHLRQDPGLDNALGLVKFEFQNSKDVYLHDTPAKNLFDQDVRTFSSGCVRLQNPFALLQYLMQPDIDWTQEKMQSILASGKTTYVKAAQPTPIFITYLTAWVDDQGKVNFRDDIYKKDNGDAGQIPQDGDPDGADGPDDNHGE